MHVNDEKRKEARWTLIRWQDDKSNHSKIHHLSKTISSGRAVENCFYCRFWHIVTDELMCGAAMSLTAAASSFVVFLLYITGIVWTSTLTFESIDHDSLVKVSKINWEQWNYYSVDDSNIGSLVLGSCLGIYVIFQTDSSVS